MNTIGIRILLLAVGYCFGLFQTGYFYGKAHGIDIRTQGSGNSGATNSLRVLGKKAGIIVLLGDCFKCLIPCLIVRFVTARSMPECAYLFMVYMALGVTLGHNFPFYMGFRGGKGIACMAGMVFASDWRIFLVCATVFFGLAFLTRYVSLSSIVLAVSLFGITVLAGELGWLGVMPVPIRVELYVLTFVIAALSIWRHKANIKRLLNGTENRLGQKK